jgi:hypothetical protein
MANYPVKWGAGDPPRSDTMARYDPAREQRLAEQGDGTPGDSTIAKIIAQLYQATLENKVIWFRDAEYFAISYMPLLAVTFRLQVSGSISSYGNAIHGTPNGKGTDPTKPQHLTIAFMDNKEYKCHPSSYPNLVQLTELVWDTFDRKYARDRNERLEWLDKALRMFLPHVVSSSVEPESE